MYIPVLYVCITKQDHVPILFNEQNKQKLLRRQILFCSVCVTYYPNCISNNQLSVLHDFLVSYP